MKKGRAKQTYFRKDYYLPTYGSAKNKNSRKTATSPATTKSTKSAPAKTKPAVAKTAKKSTPRTTVKTTSRRQSSKQQSSFSWREVTLMSLVGTSAAMIALTFILTSIFDPVKRSEREISRLAENYYIEYLYPRALGNYLDQPSVVLQGYENVGLPNVRLAQLLSYNNTTDIKSLQVFSNSYYQCDLNSTYVKFFPVAPYGPRDFTIERTMACENPNSIE